jgi:hypothetical protein
MKLKPSGYVPSHKMKPGYLARKFAEIRRQQEADRKAAEQREMADLVEQVDKVRTLARKS